MTDDTVLYYFDGRGRAEIIRMLLCAGNIKFTEVDLTERPEMLQLIEDGDLLFNAVPMLKIDGMKLVQTNAILNYLATKSGMNGKGAVEKTRIDMYFEGTRDMYMPLLTMLFAGNEDETKAKAEPRIDKFLPIYEQALEKSRSSFLVGYNLTLADIGLMEVLLSVVEFYGEDKLNDYAQIKKYIETISKLEHMNHYIKNIRKPKNTEDYINTVKKVLDF